MRSGSDQLGDFGLRHDTPMTGRKVIQLPGSDRGALEIDHFQANQLADATDLVFAALGELEAKAVATGAGHGHGA